MGATTPVHGCGHGARHAVPLPPSGRRGDRAAQRCPGTSRSREWDPALLLEVPQRGISRHVVRFVATGGHVFALKEINERLARHEYRAARRVRGGGAADGLGARHLRRPAATTRRRSWSPATSSTRCPTAGCSPARAATHSAEQLLDTLVELLVRLHLAGVFWGDCSLSNTLFRPGRRRAGRLPGRRRDRRAPPDAVAGAAGLRRRPRPRAGGRRAAGPAVRRAAARRTSTRSRWPTSLRAALRGAVERGDPRAGLRRRGAAVADRRAAAAAQRSRVRRRRGGADHLRRGRQAAGATPASPSPASTGGSCSG